MTAGVRRTRAWRESFELAVEIFRITGGLEDRQTAGLRSRLRRTAVRIPALVSRAVVRRTPGERAADLRQALGGLDDLQVGLRLCLATGHAGPDDVRQITQALEASRREIARISALDHPDPAVNGGDPLARDSLSREDESAPG